MSNKKIYIYSLIAIVILIANLTSIIYFSELGGDDILWYNKVIKNDFTKHGSRSVIGFYTEWMMWNLMVISPQLTHLFYVLVFMIPNSIILYHILYDYLRFNEEISLFSSIAPNVIATMHLLPSYTNGSYIIYVSVFIYSAILFGLKYIDRNKLVYLILSILLYIFGNLISTFGIILLVPSIIIFQLAFTPQRRSFLLSAFFAFIAFFFFLRMQFIGAKGESINIYGFNEILLRIQFIISNINPININPINDAKNISEHNIFIFLLVLTFVFAIIFMFNAKTIKKKNFLNYQEKRNKMKTIIILTLFIWLGSVSFFVLFSHWLTARYLYLATLPSALLFSISIFILIPNNYKKYAFILLFLILGFNIYKKNNINFIQQKKSKEYGSFYSKLFSEDQFPIGSQFFIIDDKPYHKGVWSYDTAYLRFKSKRTDISGHISGKNFAFDNPFQNKRSFKKGSSWRGLNLKNPIFIFEFDRISGNINRKKYYLQWLDSSNKFSSFNISELINEKGKSRIIFSGVGLKPLVNFINKKKNISSKEIAFWGFPSKKIINKMKLANNDLNLVKQAF